MKTKVFNFFGGPGTGKSTESARLYAELKSRSYNTELVREWVKTWAYEKRPIKYQEQIYIFGKQFKEEVALYGVVDAIVTDSPLILSGFYANKYEPDMPIMPMINYVLNRKDVQHYNIFLKRDKPYQEIGRYQTEEEARTIDEELKNYLNNNNIQYDLMTYDKVLAYVLNKLQGE